MSKAKAKGTSFETDVVNYLCSVGVDAMRRPLSGVNDKSDIILFKDGKIAVECKAHKTLKLSEWMTELEAEMTNLGATSGIVVAKRVRKNVAKAYVVVPLDLFVEQFLKPKLGV
jgi:Holliday junction resolvase